MKPTSGAKRSIPAFESVPEHVAIIMDGNGRWAGRRHLPRIEGHRRGAKAVENTIKAASEVGVRYLTLYAFSVENWSRPKSEVKGLMAMLVDALKRYEKSLMENGVRLKAIGRLNDLPDNVRKQIAQTEKTTAGNKKMTLFLALSYSGRVELTEAVQNIGREILAGKITPEQVDENLVSSHLYAAGVPDPDLLIRTSGEMRISNFLLWQLSYTELYITPVLWPDFGKNEFLDAIREYNSRQRRFGGV
ncbi:MAG: isoprenyl transferase [Methylacidiphilales bacterium]|nr:isoprenyl transferase [Candidatus Methylacidiphilales bacterium]